MFDFEIDHDLKIVVNFVVFFHEIIKNMKICLELNCIIFVKYNK